MKNYVVIGGSSGIGKAIVDGLKAHGANVLATYLNNECASAEHVTYFQHDVLSDEFPTEKLPETIDGIVYCPGSINLKPFHRFQEEDFINDFRLQVTGATKIVSQLMPHLKKSEHASVLFFSTVAVQNGFTFHTQVAASKGAIEGLTRALAAEWAPKIRVNAIAPSLTQTNLSSKLLSSEEKIEAHASKNPMKKIGSPKDIANAALYLLSDQASWVTGQVIPVDGGYGVMRGS